MVRPKDAPGPFALSLFAALLEAAAAARCFGTSSDLAAELLQLAVLPFKAAGQNLLMPVLLVEAAAQRLNLLLVLPLDGREASMERDDRRCRTILDGQKSRGARYGHTK